MVSKYRSVGGVILGIFITTPSFGQTEDSAPTESAPAESTEPAAPEPEVEPSADAEPPPTPTEAAPVEPSPLIAPSPLATSSAGLGAEADIETRSSERNPPTLFGSKIAIGGYGSLDVAYTRMFGRNGALLGLQGALLLDHRLSLGAGAYVWTNPKPGPDNEFGESRRYQTAYMGGLIRYAFLRNSPIYLSGGLLIGGGAVVLAPDDDDDDDRRRNRDRDDDVEREDVDLFAVFQPDVTVHANITRWMRLGVTVGYRLTAGVGRLGYDESDVNGIVAGGNIQFGYF